MNKLIKPFSFWTSEYWDFSGIDGIKTWTSLFLILSIAIVFSLFFYYKVKNKKRNDTPTGFVLLTELLLVQIQKMVIQILGKKYIKLSSYIFFLLFYINLGNMMAILGLTSPLSNISVVLSLGLITLIGSIVFGIIFKKIRFLLVLFNPMELMSLLTAFISISFRLFGNLIAGSIIMMLIYSVFTYSVATSYNGLALAMISPLHFYFDFFSGVLHSIIFSILTLTYWSLQKPEIKLEKKVEKIIKK